MQAEVLTSEDYRVPAWSVAPSGAYTLEVIKDGSIIEQLTLPNKQFILIGKNADLCDIVMTHPSISRKHAIIQYKVDDKHPYIYDLGSTHGTLVNQRKLPSRVYHKLNEYDSIVFGMSSRKYVLRSTELAEPEENQSDGQGGTEFQKMLKKQNEGGLTKQQLKDKYMEMLENDPYYKSSLNLGREFQGKKPEDEQEGINWGMSDEREVYAYRNQNDYPLEPQVLRRLPGLDNAMLMKIADYEQKLQAFQEAEGQLRDLANREQKEFGLQQKARNKKEMLQRKTVEMSQEVDKLEDYIKVNLFGEDSHRNVKQQKRAKETDTYQDDQFFDRTLNKKQQLNLNTIRQTQYGQTTEDYWHLKRSLQQLLLKRKQLNKQLFDSATRTQSLPQQQQDQYEQYMNKTEDKLKEETRAQLIQKIKFNDQAIEIYKTKLEKIRPQQKIDHNMIFEREQVSTIVVEGDPSNVQVTLTKINKIQQYKAEIDEEDQAIFSYYEKVAKEQDKAKRSYQQHLKTITASQQQPEKKQGEDPGPQKRPHRYTPRNLPKTDEQQQFFDLTKKFQ